jgi:hypothetical protein
MVPLVVLFGLVLLPLVAALLLRSNGAVAFLSVCLGSVLAGMVSADVADFVTGFTPIDSSAVAEWTRVVLVALPLLISLFATRKSVGASKQVLNFIPALAAGALLALFVVPVLPGSVKDMVTSNEFWDSLLNLETAVLLVGTLTAYALFLSLRPHLKEDDKKHK